MLSDLVERPGAALHQVLPQLPRAVDFGASQMADAVNLTWPTYHQRWQSAASAA